MRTMISFNPHKKMFAFRSTSKLFAIIWINFFHKYLDMWKWWNVKVLQRANAHHFGSLDNFL
jgi:hypothetical protein